MKTYVIEANYRSYEVTASSFERAVEMIKAGFIEEKIEDIRNARGEPDWEPDYDVFKNDFVKWQKQIDEASFSLRCTYE